MVIALGFGTTAFVEMWDTREGQKVDPTYLPK